MAESISDPSLTSCVPWEKFILAMFIPALIISLAISTDRVAGPGSRQLMNAVRHGLKMITFLHQGRVSFFDADT